MSAGNRFDWDGHCRVRRCPAAMLSSIGSTAGRRSAQTESSLKAGSECCRSMTTAQGPCCHPRFYAARKDVQPSALACRRSRLPTTIICEQSEFLFSALGREARNTIPRQARSAFLTCFSFGLRYLRSYLSSEPLPNNESPSLFHLTNDSGSILTSHRTFIFFQLSQVGREPAVFHACRIFFLFYLTSCFACTTLKAGALVSAIMIFPQRLKSLHGGPGPAGSDFVGTAGKPGRSALSAASPTCIGRNAMMILYDLEDGRFFSNDPLS